MRFARFLVTLAVASIATLAPARGWGQQASASGSPDLVAAIIANYAAIADRDTSAVRGELAGDFRWVLATGGQVVTRSELIAALARAPTAAVVTFAVDSAHVEIVGDVAMVDYRLTDRRRFGGYARSCRAARTRSSSAMGHGDWPAGRRRGSCRLPRRSRSARVRCARSWGATSTAPDSSTTCTSWAGSSSRRRAPSRRAGCLVPVSFRSPLTRSARTASRRSSSSSAMRVGASRATCSNRPTAASFERGACRTLAPPRMPRCSRLARLTHLAHLIQLTHPADAAAAGGRLAGRSWWCQRNESTLVR